MLFLCKSRQTKKMLAASTCAALTPMGVSAYFHVAFEKEANLRGSEKNQSHNEQEAGVDSTKSGFLHLHSSPQAGTAAGQQLTEGSTSTTVGSGSSDSTTVHSESGQTGQGTTMPAPADDTMPQHLSQDLRAGAPAAPQQPDMSTSGKTGPEVEPAKADGTAIDTTEQHGQKGS